eukprot:CAMPEP_0184862136 /NCGR_PEP_ID=MMETSP0580-20130426/6648_1 /TAXON_ID=1118495 /ORGANISM="Dactyliosolen fragilissimus" /LENGTH=982 /DNA_ID=CAMNT_0027359875 /DNA_START=72 /DNA_END=3017 /DNA_ORIENTATION=+
MNHHIHNNSKNDEDKVLPSFPDIRKRTLRSLYGIDTSSQKNETCNHALLRDKSPKGSVDEHIRSLVDLLNSHPSYATLSSCAGRISLFDTQQKHDLNPTTINDENYDNNNNNNDNSIVSTSMENTKGRGGWLLSSHAKIDKSQLITFLQQTDTNQYDQHQHQHDQNQNQHHQPNNLEEQMLLFQHEPLLLHVAASTLRNARKLLTLALDLGFRESGLIHTPKRITVAIRSHSLTLRVPLGKFGTRLFPNQSYLSYLVEEANRRFDLNYKRLKNLEVVIGKELFPITMEHQDDDFNNYHDCQDDAQKQICNLPQHDTLKNKHHQLKASTEANDIQSIEATFHNLPPLNLWGHASVAIDTYHIPNNNEDSNNDDDDDNHNINVNVSVNNLDLLVFGGYGTGPNIHFKTKGPSRSDKIYRLRRFSSQRQWDSKWSVVPLLPTNDYPEKQTIAGYQLQPTPFTPREGHTANILPISSTSPFPSSSTSSTATSSSMVIIFGGRMGPCNPKSNDILLFHYNSINNESSRCYTPIDVRGTPPTPRWGHASTPLFLPPPSSTSSSSSSSNPPDLPILVISGGRNEHTITPSVHILHSVESIDPPSKIFLWQQLHVNVPFFDHSTSLVMDNSSETRILVLGGMHSCQKLLLQSPSPSSSSKPHIISDPNPTSSDDDAALLSDAAKIFVWKKHNKNHLGQYDAHIETVSVVKDSMANDNVIRTDNSLFYASATCSPIFNHSHTRDDIHFDTKRKDEILSNFHLIVGGILINTEKGADRPMSCLALRQIDTEKNWKAKSIPITFRSIHEDTKIDLGCMVHHSSIVLPPTSLDSNFEKSHQSQNKAFNQEIISLGGGVPSFAFGSSYAKSYRISLKRIHDLDQNDDDFKSKDKYRQVTPKTPNPLSRSTPTFAKHLLYERDVLYVLNKNAKKAKVALEGKSFLDKRFRMMKASENAPVNDGNLHIAIPVTHKCIQFLSSRLESMLNQSCWSNFV